VIGMMRHALSSLLLVVCLFTGTACPKDDDAEYAQRRQSMVDKQIKARGITDERVLKAMTKVERHRFVPDAFKDQAYSDGPLPIGSGQTISQPYIVALMTELLKLDGNEKVLEVGTGSGYQAAILGELAAHVYSIEIVDTLAKTAGQLLKEHGYKNITVRSGDGYGGWPDQAPFDGIIVTCAPSDIPKPLKEQLAVGGRLVIPVGDEYQELLVIERQDSTFETTSVIPVRFVPMTGKVQKDK
jgi:protein-L-isoaspartate(D-aspartate) O-methyltransferase